MKKLQAQITIRLVAAMLVAMAVIGLSAITMHAPTQKPNSLTRSLKNIQTDNATLFYADQRTDRSWCVEMVLPGDRKSTRLNSSHDQISYAVFCLKKKNHRGGVLHDRRTQ